MIFDSADPGTAAREWDEDPRWQRLPRLRLGGIDHVIVFAAHPDDETLGAGGLLASARSAGIAVTFVVVTDGSGAGDVSPGETLAAVRTAEAEAAARDLGIDDVRFLGVTDGAIRENRDLVARATGGILSEFPRALVVAPWQGDGHRDHRVLGEITLEVCRREQRQLWAYPIWLWHWGNPEHANTPWSTMATLPLTGDDVAAKARALGKYRSQVHGSAPVLHERFLGHFQRPEEVFVVENEGRVAVG
ncbi:PIG-L deacetylase family protein [Frondihabitans sp. Leaf304]|uniref:PIG-L deacetylase family protein n=1 Tax=Frondihabitans sp. Leaf304 TaxID=1736329 RepID=UPI000714FD2C|nr:PIG-L deacetylase family protein [Frondihabitans sp. Leaf304]KQQ26856.1 hypothetical protein ASF54_12990 [Frondihabitans sp. Leaf304]